MAPVIRKFRVNLGNTYPANVHQTSLRIINNIENGNFRISGDGLIKGDILHGSIIISYSNVREGRPFIADVEVTFHNENVEDNDLEDTDVNFIKFKRRTLPSYPTDIILKSRAQSR